MDKQKAKIILDLSRSSSNEKVVRGLRELKKRLVTNSDNLKIFRSLGLMPHALKLVQRPNEDILNGSLSILSICCSNEDTRREVYDLGGVTHLLNVLKCAKSESLQLRACRTVANQAQHRPSCDALFKLKASDLVIEMLKNCKEDETKISAIRALRMLANTGEHSQKIVTSKGILHFCKAGFEPVESPSNVDLLRSAVRTLAHFSRISHPACVSQIMEGTDNMMTVSRVLEANTSDQEIYESVIKTIVNIVQSCFAPSHLRREALDARVLDRLCTAQFPTKIVLELQNRRVPGLDDDKLILTLCKFCQGSNECHNLAPNSLSQPPTFMGRAWMQLIDCGGVAMLVELLGRYRHHAKLRPAILKAILGVEHNYSFREPVLKHLLAAQILPQLAEQFDEVMTDYRNIRRKAQPNSCAHTFQTNNTSFVSELDVRVPAEGSNGEENQSAVTENGINLKRNDLMEKTGGSEAENSQIKESNLKDLSSAKCDNALDSGTTKGEAGVGSLKGNLPKAFNSKGNGKFMQDYITSVIPDGHGVSNPKSPGLPQSPESVSCSPHSHYSSSGHVSPTWSPAQESADSPVLQQPSASFQQTIGLIPGLPLVMDSPCPSSHGSPYASPIPSPPPSSMSPIRVPSDWEYEDEEEAEPTDDTGRFSPVMPHLKAKEIEDEEESEIEEDSQTSRECESSEKEDMRTMDLEAGSSAIDKVACKMENEEVIGDMDKKLVISSVSGKRFREASSPNGSSAPDSKKLKLTIPEPNSECETSFDKSMSACEDDESAVITENKESFALPTEPEKEQNSESKSPFVKLNQIKFRVRKKGVARQHINLGGGGGGGSTGGVGGGGGEGNVIPSSSSPLQVNTSQERNSQHNFSFPREVPCSESRRSIRERRPSSVSSFSAYSELTNDEASALQLLELLVRIIGQVAHVKEAIHKVCMEFVPRIMTYLSSVQVVHKSAMRMLVTIAKNSLCIQPLLDTLFIPYVGVELGEAGDPESPSGCQQCRIISEGATAFLDQMVNFFNHVHKYGHSEAISRLHPARDTRVREGCVMALPHVTRCPKLLHDFMVCYPAMELLMEVLRSDKPPNDANYMYATAAISRLARTLQLDKQVSPVKCLVCFQRGNHTPEEVAQHFKLQQKSTTTPTEPPHKEEPGGMTPRGNEASCTDPVHRCNWAKAGVRDVTFKLEDGSTVSASREILAEKNEVLRSMLMGSFVEGTNSCIELPERSRSSLEILIHFLYGCRCEVLDNGDVKTYIEVVFLSQMYMLNSLQAFAMAKMISSIKDGRDIITIYESSVGVIDENLILQALCTVLVKPMKTWKRARWLKEMFQSEHACDIEHNIRMILHHPLDLNRLICNCDQSKSLYRISESEYTKLC
ncbi:uncharacterized protein LOC122266852 [Penaeus japonicus]|uniref:uncharacterized protein LOC122266852 n=1 Tax=Penaeus japonicus TaxID=27405 RepID=UPI001C714C6C|nr:uncharacterized protein LOC122266852 [Penaeus japonicus]